MQNCILKYRPNYIDVKDYGAKGDGATDDTIRIQAALNTGKHVYFPATANYYKITDDLLIFGDQIIFGSGVKSKILQATAHKNVFKCDKKNNVTIRDLYLYGNTSSGATNGIGIYLISSTNIIIDSVKIENHEFSGIYGLGAVADGGNKNIRITNCLIQAGQNVGDATSDDVYFVGELSDLKVDHNSLLSSNKAGFEYNGVVGNTALGINVSHNIVKNHVQHGIIAAYGSVGLIKDVKVYKNTVDNISSSTIAGADCYGIGIYVVGSVIYDVVIDGNQVYNCLQNRSEAGSLVQGAISVAGGVTNIKVINNIVRNINNPGADKYSGINISGSDNILLAGNTVDGTVNKYFDLCIKLDAVATVKVINNDCFYADSWGFLTTGAIGHLLMSGNTFACCDLHPDVCNDIGTYVDGTVAPYIGATHYLHIANTNATTITGLDSGYEGQIVTLSFADNKSTYDRSNSVLAGGANFVSTQYDTLVLIKHGALWYEISRSVNS